MTKPKLLRSKFPKHLEYFKHARCDGCPLQGRPIVPGAGWVHSPDIAFVAEAPGETEVDEGIPLIGKSGSFLRKVINDLGIDENRCYFTNTCNCHPENNQAPTAAAAKACSYRLLSELVDIQPKLIVTLGTVSAKSLGGYSLGIKKSHGVYKDIQLRSDDFGSLSVGVLPTFHPSFILREPVYFPDFMDELEFAKQIVDGVPPIEVPPYENYKMIITQKQFDVFLEELREQELAACDIESDTTDYLTARILCIGFSWAKKHAQTVDWALLDQHSKNTRRLNDVLAEVPLSFHNGIFDVPFMIYNGLTNTNYSIDTMQLHYLLDERQSTHGLERLATKYYRAPQYKTEFRTSVGIRSYQEEAEIFSEKLRSAGQEQLFNYNGADCDYTYRLTVDLMKLVKQEGFYDVFKEIEMPSSRCFTQFYMDGMLVDRDYLAGLGRKWRNEIKEMSANIIESTNNPDFNPNSVPQLAKHLYDVLELAPFGGREQLKHPKIDENIITECIKSVDDDEEAIDFWTKRRTSMSAGMKVGKDVKGLPSRSTSAYMLYWLRRQHPFPNWILKLRHAKKRYSLYYTGIHKAMKVDGKVHPKYSLVATKTGRKATNDPAIHNIPRGDEIYNIFIPPPGWCILHADYSQAEMRMMAQYSGDQALIHMLNTSDPHTTMAKKMFHITDKAWLALEKSKQGDMRIAAKMVTFGIPYGRSPQGLAPQLRISVDEARQYIEDYFAPFPQWKSWLDAQRKRGVTDHEISSIFGRKRRFPLIPSGYYGKEVERMSGNMAIQSAINDLTLLAMINSGRRLEANHIPFQYWPHIHDSINFIVPIPMWVIAVRIVLKAMGTIPFEHIVEFPCELEVGVRWGEMITVYKTGRWQKLDSTDISIPDWLLRQIPHEVK